MLRALKALGKALKSLWWRLFGDKPALALAEPVAAPALEPAPEPLTVTESESESVAVAVTVTEADSVTAAEAVTAPAPEPIVASAPEPVAMPAPVPVAPTAARPEPVTPAAPAVPKDYVPAAESGHELYQLHLESFEGPLDLLLFLIRRHALDIFDIPIAFICQQYLAYLRRMEELNLDVASEFLATAAELLHIKSKMLLPKPAEVSDEEEADPRAELVRRLLEYQKYRDAALWLGGTTWQGRDTFAHNEETAEAPAGERSLREVGVFALIEAFGTVLARQAPELRHQVLLEQVRVSDCIRRFIDLLAQRARLRFDELVGASRDRLDVVVSFLALLEMTRLRLLKLYQSPEGTLYLERRFASIEQALHQLERIEQEQAEPRAPEVR